MGYVLKDYQSNVISLLDAYTYTVATAGLYSVEIRLTELPPSSLSIVINKNGSPVASVTSPAPAQQAINLRAPNILCAMSDVLDVTLTSTADTALNGIKAIITVGQGSNL